MANDPPDRRRPLSIHELRERIDERVRSGKAVHLTAETGWQVLAALQAYTAHPTNEQVTAIICQLRSMKTDACRPPCQRCSSAAADIRRIYRGETNPFGDGDWSGRVKR